ncbi:adenosine deaminase-like protein isoform X2 [Belonocnema kinseyi]|uniref:adenosine deaminase-like protein isoform X2 n=1 Tax=Belonocnema kinseyi TaxID=2817044 RepID=UPI00143D4194|nr:adenosine deaminase-like protein isoform X2 [Belonocnema kinseyi]
MDLNMYCHALPKVELHAHLNGSLSIRTLKKLYELQNPDGLENLEFKDVNSLKDFEEFKLAHSLTNSPKAIYIAACDVIQEFAEENVIYLELRSTPREVEGLMTKDEYTEAIIKAIKTCETKCSIIVKYLVSVDRRHGLQVAEENIDLAIELQKKYPKYVVGLDLSGDPTEGDVFLNLLEKSRDAGLRIAAHCAEVPNEVEIMDILNFRPERLGHCVCIHPSLNGSHKLFQRLLELKIPVELCLSSNVKTKSVPTYSHHQFKYLYKVGHPICICTDDKGVFRTTLSKEFELVASHFDLKNTDLKEICKLSVKYSFATDEEKKCLLQIIKNFN